MVLRYQGMDDPGTLRRKAARCFDKAASSPTTNEAKKLNEVGCQLELWADEYSAANWIGTERRSGWESGVAALA